MPSLVRPFVAALLLGCTGTPRVASSTPAIGGPMQMAIDTKGSGPALVLVGGGLTGWQSWTAHQERLAPTRTVSRAQPLNVQAGLENRPLPADYSVRMESDALAAALERASVAGAVDIVAWSYGALLTLDFALNHPGRIRTLTLIEPPAFWVLDATGEMDEQSRRERDEMKALHDAMRGDVSEEQLEAFLQQAGFGAPGVAIRSMPQWPNWVTHRRSLLQGPAVFAHRDDAARLRQFDRPVLLFKGTGSSHFLHRVIDILGATLPGATVVELPGGHAPQLVAMDEFLKILSNFHAAN
jgi:pimeloyl-ACP methyl ester carboxylesterase